ncbi:unnamed protein product [Hydatigera taeniaeformis]|uniref:Uncharacterized protein n=1 Tax=Hydatigena taeniaeformis TaxID=6205 RepID=A0A0R3WXS1_HYDTA|nr:unnamed protein product [Hydatigera taeniaeformis]
MDEMSVGVSLRPKYGCNAHAEFILNVSAPHTPHSTAAVTATLHATSFEALTTSLLMMLAQFPIKAGTQQHLRGEVPTATEFGTQL